ncbi:hypothetical protein D6C86_10409 [Aureobasidium pullulans]|uniref:F-box domain-containing protein n=1 Tax=Aureobasidium pullulans TaxID=5580 RepID=A0A4S9VID4_AURPU|nr:hypothetical protein D6C94_06125 [Aureobasidium pullulans]THZ35316.1 hypothetical protein D6C87_09879 [Aureobasidium pullulans]THZ51762.1 hypothetical protein D6C86_10409 [Aureobasidium pullulans]THZ60293.1 hypothetical protein D6C88_08819 [Aureobasidium pullulans]
MSSSATRAVSYTSLSWNPSPISSVEELSGKGRKVRERFEDLFLQCVDRQSICRGKLISIFEIFGSTSTRSLLRPNAQSIRKLRRMMRADDCAMNIYLAWSRREIMNALIQRQILIPGIESMSRTHCRIALEEADDRRSFHLMQLPKEVRLMVYEAALSAEDVFVVRGSSKPALLSVSKQVQQEASEIFFRVNRFEFRIDHGYVSPSCLGPRTQLCSVELQWLVNIGPENVANIRHLSFAHYDSWSTTITTQMDLSCLDASNCIQIRRKICKCPQACENRCRQSLTEKLNDALSDTEYRDEDGNQMKEDGIREHGQYRAAKLRKTIADLRTSFGRFRELCGTGKKVKPSVEGIKLLTLAAFLHCH